MAEWESVEQEKGFGALTLWLHRKGIKIPEGLTKEISIYFIQAQSDSFKWIADSIGTQNSLLWDEIKRANDNFKLITLKLHEVIDGLLDSEKLQNDTIKRLSDEVYRFDRRIQALEEFIKKGNSAGH